MILNFFHSVYNNCFSGSHTFQSPFFIFFSEALIARFILNSLMPLFICIVYMYFYNKKTLYQNIKIFTILCAFSRYMHLPATIFPQSCHSLVCIEFSERSIDRFSHACHFKLSGHKRPVESRMSTLIKPLSFEKVTETFFSSLFSGEKRVRGCENVFELLCKYHSSRWVSKLPNLVWPKYKTMNQQLC